MIVSTGFNLTAIAPEWSSGMVDTIHGVIPFRTAMVNEATIYAVTRNGFRTACPPHAVNHLGIMAAFKTLRVSKVLATSMVGSLREEIPPGTVVILDQFLDFTRTRSNTIFGPEGFAFCDFTEPYCPAQRNVFIAACEQLGLPHQPTGCYVGVDGPRYETAAEVKMYRLLGGDIVGMTNIPESIYARENGLCYAAAALVVNYGAGLASKVTRLDCYEQTLHHIGDMELLLKQALQLLPQVSTACACSTVADDVIRLR